MVSGRPLTATLGSRGFLSANALCAHTPVMSEVGLAPFMRRDMSLAGFVLQGRWPEALREWVQVLALAARLAAVADVTLVSRGERTSALHERGITISGRESTHARVAVVAAEDHPAVPPGALVLVTTKITQLEGALGSVTLSPGATVKETPSSVGSSGRAG